MKTKIFLLIPALFIFLFACADNNTEKKEFKYSEVLAQIVSKSTSGSIQSGESIKVWFNSSIVNEDEVNKEVENELFSFSPTIEGKTYWANTSLLVFEPEEPLEFRENYTASLNIKALISDSSSSKIENLVFDFNILGREISNFSGNLTLKDKNNPNVVNYRGLLGFTEKTDLEDLKKSLLLKGDGKEYKLEIFIEPGTNNFSFISEDILREKDTKDFKLIIDHDILDLAEDFTEEFQVTTLSELRIVNVKKLEDDIKPKIRLEFSDELDFEQQIKGLITVEELNEINIQRIGSSLVLDGDFKFGEKYSITVEKGIRSRWGTKLKKKFIDKLIFSNIKPQVSFASDGVFLPESNNYKLQFYTSNLKRVHIEIKKVYENNLSEFIRSEKINSSSQRKESFNGSYINRVGVIVHNETFELSSEKNKRLLNEIDLTNLIQKNDKGLFLVRLNFNPKDMLVNWGDNKYRFIEEEGQIYKPLFFSNIGLTCKYGDSKYRVYATDLITAKPKSGVKLTLRYLYQYYNADIVSNAVTDEDGIATLTHKDRYWRDFYIEAEKDGHKSIIKFNEMSWNNSGFDIGGINESNTGIKAFAYTERGVYRPGDEINLSVIARNSKEDFPDNHPITLSLFNPQRKKVTEITNKDNKDGFYNFKLNTEESDPTGNWQAQFNIGNQKFFHTIKIETVVPYKLKVEIKPEHKTLLWNHKNVKFNVLSKYLFGTPSAELPLDVELDIVSSPKRFNEFGNFVFSNPTFDFKRIKKNIFKGNLDDEGMKDITWDFPSFENLPSALNVKLTATVTEKGGRPNKNWVNIPYEPYSHYVGLQPPKYRYARTGADLEIPAILLDSKGNAISGKTIKYKIYRNSTYWWWHYGYEKKLKFKSDNSTVLVKTGEIVSQKTHANIEFVPIDKGEYFIEVIDESGTKHSAGIFIYAGIYGGRAGGDKNAGTLALLSDKEKYFIGDEAIVSFPAPTQGSILFTIEKGNRILEEKWYKPDGNDEMIIKVPITKEMVPNAYISLSIIQPHSQTINDRPIRTFGILPLNVEDKNTKHFIDIKNLPQFRPEEDFVVNLQTSDRKQSQFTIAVVDEGLLDITQHKTPNPWKYFFSKIRLAVNTYDIFSHVIAANIGDIFKTFSIGGGMDYRESQLQPEKGKKRFKPVSLFKGPITTDLNGKASVKFSMPNYIGSVRIMVIGARGNSYSRAEKAVPVKKELMIMPTLPRVVGPNEKFRIPVTVFGLKENIGKVNIEIKTEGPIEIDGSKINHLTFKEISDQDCYFNVSTLSEVGQTKIQIKAKSDKYSASYDVDLMVRPTSARIYKSADYKITKGKNQEILIPEDGIKGTNRATLTVSSFPNINFGHRLKWLIRYPYGCIEQTTSAVFPQLFIKRFIKYPEANSEKIDRNITIGIENLRKFQIFSGALSYWPYGAEKSDWGTLYAGHFMVEAKKLGYHTPEDLYLNWLNYNKGEAQRHSGTLVSRVYRAYILAVAGDAELSEMNALKESNLSDMKNTQKWLLAAAYKLAGLETDAEILASNLGVTVEDYKEFSGSYGSALRDKAMMLEAMVVLDRFDIADEITKEISSAISSQRWYSTQTLGYSLLGIGKYINAIYKDVEKSIVKGYIEKPNGDQIPLNSNESLNLEITEGFGQPINLFIDNETTTENVYVTLAWDGVPIKSNLITENKNLKLTVDWLDEDGNNLDPTELKQGATFYGKFNVVNSSGLKRVDEVALLQILPSGWEIVNTRLLDEALPLWTQNMRLNREEYTDIRDDRIIWFFDIHPYWIKNKKYNDYNFILKLTAVTVGEFELPGTLAEAMYNNNFRASKESKKVRVVKP